MLHHAACGTGHVIGIALRDADEVILKCVPSFSNRFMPPLVTDYVHQIQASEKLLGPKNKFAINMFREINYLGCYSRE